MPETQSHGHVFVGKKIGTEVDDFEGDDVFMAKKSILPSMATENDPVAALASVRLEFGMLAISSVLLQLYSSGGHVMASRMLYDGTHALLTHFFPRVCNITTMFVDIGDLEAVKKAIVEGKNKVLKEPRCFVDNTFAPVVLSPARLDADVVLHSISKFISVGSMLLQVRLSFFHDPHLF
ncbi:hypothetical protein GQ457_06G000360 [Hibiscus cannabinus]